MTKVTGRNRYGELMSYMGLWRLWDVAKVYGNGYLIYDPKTSGCDLFVLNAQPLPFVPLADRDEPQHGLDPGLLPGPTRGGPPAGQPESQHRAPRKGEASAPRSSSGPDCSKPD